MKKALYYVIVTVLITTSILGIMNIYNKKEQQKQIDQLFISSLVEARSSLSSDYSNADESTKTYHYTRLSSNLYTAVNILDFSSYNHNKNRNQLFGGIYNLYLCMTQPDTRSDIITNKSTIVSEYLTKIINDTNDKEACEALDKLTGDIYFKH